MAKRKKLKLNAVEREKLILEHTQLVKMVAHRIASKLPASIEFNDLVSTGYIGLMDAIERFDPSRGIKFKTYAEIRISGTIRDELRQLDWLPRSVRDKVKEIEKAQTEVERVFGRAASDTEIAKAMGIDLEKFHATVGRVKALSMSSLDDIPVRGGERRTALIERIVDKKSKNSYESLERKSIRQALIERIDGLDERHRFVLALYYYEDMSLKEIGRVVNMSESRISQIHTQAIIRLWSEVRRSLRKDFHRDRSKTSAQ